MSQAKKVPERMCAACKTMKTKENLFRIVKTDDGAMLDLTYKAGGRGCYVCRSHECIAKAAKNKAFQKQHGVALSAELISQMEKLIEQ